MQVGIKISRFWTNNSLYLANDTRYRHSYHGQLIGTHMRSNKWCHFQWPWTIPNPVFKVTPLFDAKYVTNCYYSYYRRRIWNRTQAFEWHQFQWLEWPLTQISRSRYYSTSNNSKIVQDKAIFTMADDRPHLQWSWTIRFQGNASTLNIVINHTYDGRQI